LESLIKLVDAKLIGIFALIRYQTFADVAPLASDYISGFLSLVVSRPDTFTIAVVKSLLLETYSSPLAECIAGNLSSNASPAASATIIAVVYAVKRRRSLCLLEILYLRTKKNE
jgi:hypothetical protein